jgi:hypothetical protein
MTALDAPAGGIGLTGRGAPAEPGAGAWAGREEDMTQPTRQPQSEEIKLNVSLTQIMASALASVSAAVVASYFGVTGTIIGTAVVSVVATTGSAVYALWLRRTHRHIQRLRDQAALRASATAPGNGRRPRPRAGGRPFPAPPVALGAPVATPADVTIAHQRVPSRPPTGWRARLGRVRMPVVGGVLAVFVIAAGVVTVIEVAANKPLSAVVTGTGGSGTSLFGGRVRTTPTTTPVTTPTTTTAPGRPTTTQAPAATTTTTPPATTTTTTPPATTTTTVPASPSTTAAGSAGAPNSRHRSPAAAAPGGGG